MPLTDEQKDKVRYHLGYTGLSLVGTLSFGGVVVQQMAFLLEKNLTNLRESMVPIVQQLICNLDELDCLLMQAARDGRIVRTGGGVQINLDQAAAVKAQYVDWAGRLADQFSVTFDPLSRRFAAASSGVNVPVL